MSHILVKEEDLKLINYLEDEEENDGPIYEESAPKWEVHPLIEEPKLLEEIIIIKNSSDEPSRLMA